MISLKELIKDLKEKDKEKYNKSVESLKNYLSHPSLGQIILNFSECNLNCSYCFAKRFRSLPKIPHERIKKRLLSAISKLKTNNQMRFVSSFIGESLLYQKQILDIAETLEKGKYFSSIDYFFLTNGAIPLSNEFISFFQEKKVIFQVSFDFYPRKNDLSRYDLNHEGTSYRTLDFIETLKQKNFRFYIKMNMYKCNLDHSLRSYDFILSDLRDIGIAVSTVVGLADSKNTGIKEPLSIYEKNNYLFFYLLNRLFFKDEKIAFLKFSDFTGFCMYYYTLAFTDFSDFVSGCEASVSSETFYGKFVNDEFVPIENNLNFDWMIQEILDICKNCEYRDFCGLKACIKVKENNFCSTREYLQERYLIKAEEKYQTYPFFIFDKGKISLYHPFKTLIFEKISDNPDSNFLYETNFNRLRNYILRYDNDDFKIILFYNKQKVFSPQIRALSELLKEKHLFVVFVRHCESLKEVSHRLIIPKKNTENLDLFQYDPNTKTLITPKEVIKNFNIKDTLLDRNAF